MIVAIGFSSREGIGATTAANTHTIYLDTILPQSFKGVQLLIKDIGGQTAADILKRFTKDLLVATSDLVIRLATISDASQNKEPKEV
ncbi:hypothetical protein SAMN07250955_107177 [Arboricoccus pini]|uniref:Uncharacterized protein n=1 Tax=Arboricoccus pini TaxID=1963835 RepID=A0A212RDH2_9PROT|nr:hypothetical protein [Arboricoccus pini]SNB70355.1 hypothetical protein SAMN07250955_107177 [Arboricoccus pini]